MLNNRIELNRDHAPQALLTWHKPKEEGHFYPIAFQFAEDLDEEMKRQILDVAKRPIKLADKGFKTATIGSSDHFSALPKKLERLGYRTRSFGAAQRGHVLEDRPVEEP